MTIPPTHQNNPRTKSEKVFLAPIGAGIEVSLPLETEPEGIDDQAFRFQDRDESASVIDREPKEIKV